MDCEHIKHEGDECYHCGATAWICFGDMRSQRDDARVTIAELRALLEKAVRWVPWSAEDEARLDALGVDGRVER